LPQSFATLRRLDDFTRTTRPDALVVIDFAGFNFRLAQRIKQRGIPIICYVSPRSGPGVLAARTIREIADLVLVIFPFEEKIYREAGVPVMFVGHPLIDLTAAGDKAAFLRRSGLSPTAPTVAILPGSRSSEVRRLLPDLLAAAGRIRASVPTVQFIVARAPGLADHLFTGVGGVAASVEGRPTRSCRRRMSP
jgi:lipid-A-disaccharide synthase